MKQIINKKMYNTETATQISDYWNGLSHSDFNYVLESLFLTKNGAWFLYAKGGANSKYCICNSSYSSSSQKIIPLAPEAAYQWLESNNKHKTIEEFFPDYFEAA